MTLLVNTTNLHVGGGVQVATSFASEVLAMEDLPQRPVFLLSGEVARNLAAQRLDPARLAGLEVMDARSLGFGSRSARRRMDKAQAVFTVFGPLYRLRPRFRSIVGFAQPWIIYPRNECFAMLPPLQRWMTRLKYRIQGWFFRRADVLVVELEHVRQGLVRELGIPIERIHVVHNCLSRVFLEPDLWQPAPMPPAPMPQMECDLRLGFLGRNYLHKNTGIFPAIVAALARDHGIRARFHVTFTPEEWRAATPEFRAACVNVGPLTIAQCPSFYRGVDAVVFPSLLECFSATPLEAMAMERPLFASDRPFNRDVCGPHARYFDPLSPESAARALAGAFAQGAPDPDGLRRARAHAIGFSNPADRAKHYLSLLEGQSAAPIKP